MNGMRKWVGLLMALAFAAFALPAAAQKVYTLNLSTSTLAAGSSGLPLTATMNNISSDQGNSTIKSFKLWAPAGITIKTPATSLSVPVNIGNGYTALIQNNGSSIYLSSINIPLKPFAAQPVVLSMTVDTDCGAGGNWTTFQGGKYQVWNGSAFTGQTFDQQPPSNLTTTFAAGGCHGVTYDGNGNTGGSVPTDDTLYPAGAKVTVLGNTGNLAKSGSYFTGWTVPPSGTIYVAGSQYTMGTTATTFVAKWAPKALTVASPPTSAAVDVEFSVTVTETPGGPEPSMTSTCGATETHTYTSTSTVFKVTVPSPVPNPAVCTITFAVTDSDYTSYVLNLNVYKGVLDCGDYDSSLGSANHKYDPDLASSDPNMGTAFVGTPGWGLRRGPNRDGASCVKVNYTCELTADATNNLAKCTFDKGPPDATHPNGQLATFKYLFLWAARDNVDGWTNFRPQVSWGIANPDQTTSRAYLTPDWVPLLSCLDGDFPLSGLPTTILPTIPSVLPFTDNVAPNGKNTRAQYQPGVTALVCGAQQGWTSVGSGKLQIWNIIIDESDVLVKGPS